MSWKGNLLLPLSSLLLPLLVLLLLVLLLLPLLVLLLLVLLLLLSLLLLLLKHLAPCLMLSVGLSQGKAFSLLVTTKKHPSPLPTPTLPPKVASRLLCRSIYGATHCAHVKSCSPTNKKLYHNSDMFRTMLT